MLDLVVRRATLPDGRRDMDIACLDGRIVELAAKIEARIGPGQPVCILRRIVRRLIHGTKAGRRNCSGWHEAYL